MTLEKNYDLFPSEPNLKSAGSSRNSISGSVMDGLAVGPRKVNYVVTRRRWVILALFVVYSASNSMQWTQYTIINDVVVAYYGVDSTLVSWTSLIYMITYVPFIFPASWLLDKTVSFLHLIKATIHG